MSEINTGNVDITTEDKQINSKPSEPNDNNIINIRNVPDENNINNNNPPRED